MLKKNRKNKGVKGATFNRVRASLRSAGVKITRPPCIGEIVYQIYSAMSYDVKTSDISEEMRKGATWVMHATDFHLSSLCGCERCKKHVAKLQIYLKGPHEDRSGVTPDGDGTTVEAEVQGI